MNKLYFINNWAKLETAWSGTPNGIYSALSQKIISYKVDAYKPITKHKLLRKISTISEILTMGLLKLRYINRIINNTAIPSGVPLFVFGEYSTQFVKNTYCYQDLSVDYVLRLRKQNLPESSYVVKSVIPTCLVKKKQKIANQFYENCAGIFTMSEWLYRDLVENTDISANKVHHVGGGCSVDISRIDYSKKTGNKFLFVGKAWERKNGELVVEAFKKLCASNSNCQPELYIAGPSTKPKCIQDNDNIFFLGRLTYDELATYYNMCDYFVMPSKFEAYGLVFAEALCFGLPCIGKDICAMPEFIQEGQNGLLIQNDDPDELAAAMDKMLTDGPAMANFVQENRSTYVEKYSWDSVANRIIDVLREDGYFDSDV